MPIFVSLKVFPWITSIARLSISGIPKPHLLSTYFYLTFIVWRIHNLDTETTANLYHFLYTHFLPVIPTYIFIILPKPRSVVPQARHETQTVIHFPSRAHVVTTITGLDRGSRHVLHCPPRFPQPRLHHPRITDSSPSAFGPRRCRMRA